MTATTLPSKVTMNNYVMHIIMFTVWLVIMMHVNRILIAQCLYYMCI